MKRFFSPILACAALGVAVVTMLHLSASRINHEYNTFVRLTPPHLLNNPKSLDLGYNSYYFAGATQQNIYLGNSTAPLHTLRCNYALTDSVHIKLSVSESDSVAWKALSVEIDSPFVFMMDRVTPAVLLGTLSDPQLHTDFLNIQNVKSIVPISPTSFAAVAYDVETKKRILAKERLHAAVTLNDVLVKQIDGSFCTDGIMIHDRAMPRNVFYIYFYRNQFIRLDSDLNVMLTGKTIDTVSKAKLKVVEVSSGQYMTLAEPPLFVNLDAEVSGAYLFIHSALRAKNEDTETFENNSAIDVYSIDTGIYRFSFYLPKYKGNTLTDFRIWNNHLFAINGNYLLSYTLNFNIDGAL